MTSQESSKFPSQEVVNKIQNLPTFNADVSAFIDKMPEEIAEWVRNQDGEVVLNISNADPSEVSNFEAANKLLAESGDPEITLFDNEAQIAEITRSISSEAVEIEGKVECFRAFIEKVLQPANFVDEFNTFVAPRGKSLKDVHYWNNIGLADPEDELREDVLTLLESVGGELAEEDLSKLDKNPGMGDPKEISTAIKLGMLSHAVRGHLYKTLDASKVHGLRDVAVRTYQEELEKAQG